MNYQSPYIPLFYGLVEILYINKKYVEMQKLIPQIQVLVSKQKLTTLFNQLIETGNFASFANSTNETEIYELMRQFIYQEYSIRIPPVIRQEILKQISSTFNVNIQFVSPNLQMQISSSENLPQVLQLIQENGYRYQIQNDYQIKQNVECLGCLRLFPHEQIHKSLLCQHTYCRDCLKVYFKMGQFFVCRDFFCQLRLSRDDFPLFIASPLIQIQAEVCQRCKSINNLFTNKCGHTFCKECIDRKVHFMSQYQTLFCLEPTCTELLQLKNQCGICNKENNLVQQPCNDYICQDCLLTAYQDIISHGLSHKVPCQKCSKFYDIGKLYEGQFQMPVNREVRSYSSQTLQTDPNLLTTTTTTRRTLSRSRIIYQDVPQTPKRVMAQSFVSSQGPSFY